MTLPLFRLGQLVATPGAIEVMERLGINPADLIARHVTGDWGDIHPDDRGLNEQAVQDGSRIFSVYGPKHSDDRLWVITDMAVGPVDDTAAPDDPDDADVSGMAGKRLATTILRPDEY